MTLPVNDGRWSTLRDVDGAAYDPRLALLRLKSGDDSAWNEPWSHLEAGVQ